MDDLTGAFRERTREERERTEKASQMPHRSGFDDPFDERLVDLLGRARIGGLISEAEYRAGQEWSKVHYIYMATIKYPENFTDQRCETAASAYKRGVDIMSEHGKRTMHAVFAICAYGEDWGDFDYTVRAAKVGLAALAQRF